MNAAPLLLVLALALPASAQIFVSADQADGLAAAAKSARTLREKLMPAAVDPGPVKLLTGRLAMDGERVEMEQGIGNIYTRIGKPDANGRFEKLQANLVEIPVEFAGRPGDSMLRRAVMRRCFSHLEVTSEFWEADPKTGKGTVHVWIYRVALEGRLMSVEHQIAPVEEKARLSPSDPSVQRRWKELAKELMTLGRVVKV